MLAAVPEGAEVHIALSETLSELGVTETIDESGRYDSIRAKLSTLDRATQGREMRKLGAAPDYIIGSAHAITDDGQIVVGSGSGSQLGAYAYAGGNVILVVGHQKLVRDLDAGPPPRARVQPAARVRSDAARRLPRKPPREDADHSQRTLRRGSRSSSSRRRSATETERS